MSLIGTPNEGRVVQAWEKSMEDILHVKSESDIPELNIYQCGTCAMHSLQEAHDIAKHILDARVGIMDNDALRLDVKTLVP